MDARFDCCHAYNKSIAGYEIFRDKSDYLRMLGILDYYRFVDPALSYSHFRSLSLSAQSRLISQNNAGQHVRILAYCLMPTHFHLVLELMDSDGMSQYLRVCLDAYTRYFNKRYSRKGPLWQGRVSRTSVEAGEAFLYVTRYVHLNPVTAFLVDDPKDWMYSSYGRYVGCPNNGIDSMVCTDHLKMTAKAYRTFVVNHKDEQRRISRFKKLLLE